MKPLLIASLLALAAPSASAGDVDFHFGFRGGGVRIGVGVHKDEYRREFHRHRRPRVVCERVWVSGYYETVERRVWVPGYYERVYRPAEFRYRRDACGRPVRILVRPARHDRVLVPGHYEVRYEKTWHPGHWDYACQERHSHHGRH